MKSKIGEKKLVGIIIGTNENGKSILNPRVKAFKKRVVNIINRIASFRRKLGVSISQTFGAKNEERWPSEYSNVERSSNNITTSQSAYANR